MRRLRGFAVAVLVGLVWASVAMAQDPAQTGYGGVGGNVQGEVEGGGGALPFTGLDLLLLVAAGAVLLGAGLVVRRLGRARG